MTVTEGTQDDFLERLAAAQSALSPKMASLAGFLGESYVQAAFMTTREIAAAAGVSLATVIRFPGVLGYPDFDALRSSIRDRVHFDLTAVERMRAVSKAAGTRTQRVPGGPYSTLLHRVIDSDIENLAALTQSSTEARIERFVCAVLEAERVFISGFRYAAPLASYMGYSLDRIKPNVETWSQADSLLYDRVHFMEDADVLIAISLARYSRDHLSLVQYAHGLGRRVLAITDGPLSPILPCAEISLFAKSSVLDFVGSLAAPAALINCVVSEVGVRMGEPALRRLEALEEAAEQAQIYVSSGRR